jgi:sugar/nucleoside kinase (ribokinase family)
VRVVNPVGAGNAYAGGFLAGWAQTEDLVTAGLQGAVAASFVLEHLGLAVPTDEMRREARQRMEQLRPRVHRVAL